MTEQWIGKYWRIREAKEGKSKKNGYVIVKGHDKRKIYQEVVKATDTHLLIDYTCTETGNPCAYWVCKEQWLRQNWRKV